MSKMEALSGTLQENIISLLAHSDTHGKIISQLVQPQLFEGEYRVIAERCVEYWTRHGEAPGAHMIDLVDDIVSDKSNRKAGTYKRILGSMLDLVDNINSAYVLDQLHIFVRMQRFKDAILKSAEQLNAKQEIAVVEVEKIWNDLLKTRITTFDRGTSLLDYKKLLDYMETQYAEFITGIAPLDKAHIVPSRGAVMLFLAAAKRGKSWFLISTGVRALMLRKRVAHITLEMSEMQVLQRYYQSIFAITKDGLETTNRVIERDEDDNLKSLTEEDIKLELAFSNPEIEVELREHIKLMGPKNENLRIKSFPIRSVDCGAIEAWLESLEITEGFIPDMIVLDYAGILKTDPKNPRISLGRALEEFRGMCVRRNAAGVTAHQLSKAGAEAMTASSRNVSEDWSMIGTADITLVFSSTDAEKALGLGRLRVTDARDAKDNFGVLLTQNYASGQFVIDSIRLSSDYYEMLEELKETNDLSDSDDEEDDE